ncbi:MAG: sn-glycerol-3-phosphate ABC transporter ATP-binding protein UgpC [Clostridia bacterium]|nr:sn-glycerol-3-phosphate ABC transporter ATP-binding protein UgpC [Clostridia bacterium]MDY3784581.1 sn-glycerol-3-phosphate ABC transporter ATP-binding protein UgpC [Eubacteriales bacterium]
MASLSLKHIYKKYPGGVTAVSDFNLEIKDKEFLILVGPSGCGKTTTLRMIAGLEEITEGELFIGDRLVNDVAPKDRDIAMVFQNYALYPHMTVFENMAFGLRLRKTPKEEIKRRVEEAARILDITHLLDRKPKALSGGQKQRVALGRAIVRNPKVFLLDEPLSNLDAKLRAAMRTELTKIHKSVGTTFVYVTHDQVEAMTMATRIVVMKDGLIQQVDTPQNLYDSPVNVFVAGFIGTPQMNFVNGILEKKGEDLYFNFEKTSETDKMTAAYRDKEYKASIKLPAEKANNPALKDYIGQEVIAGIRPEAIHDEPMHLQALADSTIDVDVEVTELMGAEIYLYLTVGETRLIARVSSRSTSRAGDKIKVAIDTSRIHFFDKDTERFIVH